MPVNALRKSGARMSLQEALERVEKLKRLSHSSNVHEAALAASTFPRVQAQEGMFKKVRSARPQAL